MLHERRTDQRVGGPRRASEPQPRVSLPATARTAAPSDGTPRPSLLPADTPDKFRIGDGVEYAGTGCLNIRSEPGMSSHVVRCVPSDVFRATVIDGPHMADGYRWWKLLMNHFRGRDERTGWAREDLLQPFAGSP